MRNERTVIGFSFKSAFFVILTILAASLLFSVLLDSLNLGLYYLRVLVIGLATGWSVSHALYFMETDRGRTKGYWVLFAIITILSSFISYFWVFDIYYL